MEISGIFYFKKTTNGNLIGEFTNNKMNSLSVECSQLISEKENIFEGNYRTTWIEGEKSESSYLEIKLQSKSKYELIWKSDSNTISFRGNGFVIDKILIGAYSN